jgi:glutaredoxin
LSDIVLYSTGCPKCAILKERLNKTGVLYTENNSVDEMIRLGITQVPALMVGARLMGYYDAVKWAITEGKSEREEA